MALTLAQAGSTPTATDVNDTSTLPKAGAKIAQPGGFGAGYGAPSAGILSQVQAGGGTSTSSAAGGQAPLTMAAAPAIPTPTVAGPSAPVDRLSLAESNFNNFANSTQGAYDASLRSATSQAAGAGQLGSGQLRTSLGDLSLARARDLDTQRTDLVNKATEGSIADASTAFQQGLAGAQQGLAAQLGTGNLSIAQQQANTAEKGTVGSLGVQQGQLELAKTGQAASIDQSQQQIDLAKKTADINAQYQAGTLTLAQKDQALRELSNTQQNTIATGQLDLAQKAQADQMAEATAARLQQGAQFNASQAQSKEEFNQSLAQNAQQFGLSQDQTQKLAALQDATANRSIDVSQAQGQNQLLVQLASILGGPTGTLNPDVMKAIAQKFGVTLPGSTGTGGTGTGGAGTGGTGGTGTGGQGGTDGGDTGGVRRNNG